MAFVTAATMDENVQSNLECGGSSYRLSSSTHSVRLPYKQKAEGGSCCHRTPCLAIMLAGSCQFAISLRGNERRAKIELSMKSSAWIRA